MLPGLNRELLGRQLEKAIKTGVGISTRVRVLPSGSVERTAVGKARRVVDQRPKLVPERPVGAI